MPDLDEVRAAMERMISDGRRAGEVVRRLRAMSRKGMSRHEPVDLEEIIDESIVLVRREIERHGVALQLDVAGFLPPANGDRVQLQQVLINLLVNSLQAMSAAGDSPRELRIGVAPNDAGLIEIFVEDTGPGLSVEAAERLFDAFYTTKPEGMGMGLSICRSIVEAHGGRISATNRLDRPGASFRVTLPVQA